MARCWGFAFFISFFLWYVKVPWTQVSPSVVHLQDVSVLHHQDSASSLAGPSWITPLFCCPEVPEAASQGDEAGKGRNERKWEEELTKSSPCFANTSVCFPHAFSPSLLQTSQHRVPLLCQMWNRDDHICKVSLLRRESPLLPPPASLLSLGPRILCSYKLFFPRKGSGQFTDWHEGNLWLWQSPPGIFLGLSPFPFLFFGGRALNQIP